MPDFVFQNSQLHYTRTGTGSEILLAFHGFGQTHAHFASLAAQLADRYTVYTFDLFYHGHSRWSHREQPLTKAQWRQGMESFLAQENIGVFALAGFSLGGKFALATLEAFPERVTELILIAPDGVKTSFWYSLATYPSWTRRLFRRVVVRPGEFQQLARLMRRLRLVDKGVLRFAESQMNTREKRHRVYFSWMVFRDFAFDMERMADEINRRHIPLTMFLGRYDKIITQANMTRLLKRVPHHRLVVLDSGHSQLLEAVAEYYAEKRAVKNDK
ncbi:MAG: alpha/beta hydrolase [Cytophagales bacterium]|nr:alpha/beta hydrolase [Cytophagales bacterium]